MTPSSLRRILTPLVSCSLTMLLFAQAAPTPPLAPTAVSAPGDAVVELSPFTVNAAADKGYRAENTLAGSRLNTSLRDTPSSVSVFTEKFLEDLGINQIEDFIGYTVGATLGVQDTNAGSIAYSRVDFVEPRSIRFTTSFSF